MRPAFYTGFTHIRAYSTDEIRQRCLALMRATAQSVSVITTVLPTIEADDAPVYHGATLSSFTSIAMYPQPLVSFSLRTPSRMAESLQRSKNSVIPHMVINLLSATQAHLALQFSRPREHPFACVPYYLSLEGIPILRGCIGAFSCSLVRSVPLGDTYPESSGGSIPAERHGEEQGSQLFVGRVHRVEAVSPPELMSMEDPPEDSEKGMLPLIYYRQKYVTVDLAHHLMLPGIPSSNNNDS